MPARKWWPLGVVVTGIFMLLVDITIVNVALPQIGRSLDAGFTDLQWVIDADSLALATFVLNAGALADLYGRRKVFPGGLVIFTLSSIACGLGAVLAPALVRSDGLDAHEPDDDTEAPERASARERATA